MEMLNLDRFSAPHWKEKPFTSSYDPDRNNPIERVVVRACDICGENAGILEAPSKCKITWCRYCDSETRKSFNLKEDDVSYV